MPFTTFSRSGLEPRWQRWQQRSFFLVQCALTAGIAYWIATGLLGHTTPFFAPVAAMIVLGVSFGQRMRRAVEVAVGATVGVGVGDVVVHVIGTGVWQLVVIVFLAMSIATLLNGGALVVTQAGMQAVIVATLLPSPSDGMGRWLDAVIGCGLALLVATLAPTGPLAKPRILAARVLDEVAATVRDLRDCLVAGDRDAAEAALERARATTTLLTALNEASAEGLAVARHSVLRKRSIPAVQPYADLAVPLDRLARNLRIVARRAVVATWRNEEIPRSYLAALDQLAEVVVFAAGELWNRRLPVAARSRLVALGVETSYLGVDSSLSAVTILAQTRSMVHDLLMLTGLSADAARALIPEMHEAARPAAPSATVDLAS